MVIREILDRQATATTEISSSRRMVRRGIIGVAGAALAVSCAPPLAHAAESSPDQSSPSPATAGAFEHEPSPSPDVAEQLGQEAVSRTLAGEAESTATESPTSEFSPTSGPDAPEMIVNDGCGRAGDTYTAPHTNGAFEYEGPNGPLFPGQENSTGGAAEVSINLYNFATGAYTQGWRRLRYENDEPCPENPDEIWTGEISECTDGLAGGKVANVEVFYKNTEDNHESKKVIAELEPRDPGPYSRSEMVDFGTVPDGETKPGTVELSEGTYDGVAYEVSGTPWKQIAETEFEVDCDPDDPEDPDDPKPPKQKVKKPKLSFKTKKGKGRLRQVVYSLKNPKANDKVMKAQVERRGPKGKLLRKWRLNADPGEKEVKRTYANKRGTKYIFRFQVGGKKYGARKKVRGAASS